MSDPFRSHMTGINGPALGAQAITPSDEADLPTPLRAVTLGSTGGTLSFVSSRDGQTYTTGPLPLGTYPLFARRIRATGTTATGLTGWV